jgi:hypothetical protein
MNSKTLGWGVALVVSAISLAMFGSQPRMQAQAAPQNSGGARYTVVDSDATNLTVVDNGSNTIYFYAEEPGQPVGQELQLRGSIDLSEVGKSVLRPKSAK